MRPATACVPLPKRITHRALYAPVVRMERGARARMHASGSVRPTLSDDEAASLRAALDRFGLGTAAELSTRQDLQEQLLRTLSAGLERQEPDLVALEGAILLAEQLAAVTPSTSPNKGMPLGPLCASDAPYDVAVWQPVFASAGGFPRLLYIPVPEFFVLSGAAPCDAAGAGGGDSVQQLPGELDVVTELGPFVTHFLGRAGWSGPATLEYVVNALRICWRGSNSTGLTLTLPGWLHLKNALQFFVSDSTTGLAAARSALGGTMLLQREPPAGARYRSCP